MAELYDRGGYWPRTPQVPFLFRRQRCERAPFPSVFTPGLVPLEKRLQSVVLFGGRNDHLGKLDDWAAIPGGKMKGTSVF